MHTFNNLSVYHPKILGMRGIIYGGMIEVLKTSSCLNIEALFC